ncbi:protein cereblon-like [Limulus polyphemus]|uniref:Protein cereblon n=1 Tax=Limulus polyphemus TaxID=6850 RepID=A0ABM1TSK6_LIMPO|nr:protein cereblon-like [Limulus polyphemus]
MEHLYEYAKNTSDVELLNKIRFVRQHRERIPEYVEIIKTKCTYPMDMANVVFTTAHKSKGLEFDTVCVKDDFTIGNIPYQEPSQRTPELENEFNVLYVAISRAKKRLCISTSVYYLLLGAQEKFEYPAYLKNLMYDRLPYKLECVSCKDQFESRNVLLLVRRPFRTANNHLIPGGPVCPICVTKSGYSPLFPHPDMGYVGSITDNVRQSLSCLNVAECVLVLGSANVVEETLYKDGVVNKNDEKKGKNPDVSYDISLPSQHTYLGNDLEELSGRTLLDDNSCQNLPLLPLPGIVLVPGQTIPLQLFEPSVISMVKRIIEKDHTLGIINSRYQAPLPGVVCVGTTAEIRSYREEADENVGLSTLRLKAEGRQRFQIIETMRQIDGVLMAKIRILPEVTVYIYFYDRFDFANYTRWPRWVYHQYDAILIVQRIRQELEKWNCFIPTDKTPKTPLDFSYWVAANLPLDDNKRLCLLGLNNAIQRLRCELSMLKRYRTLCCLDIFCNIDIANRHDIFSMSLEGPQGTYVNPSGYVHEIITTYKARGLLLFGSPSTEQSWFPGYAWTAASCSGCDNHIGWKFTTTNRKLEPQQFWGLCRAALRPAFCSDIEDELWEPNI